MTRVSGEFDTPLYPCRTIVSYKGFNGCLADHQDLYIHSGFMVGIVRNNVTVIRLPSLASKSWRKFSLAVIPANPLLVLPRVRSAIGPVVCNPFSVTCREVVHWLLTGSHVEDVHVHRIANGIWLAIIVSLLVVAVFTLTKIQK